MNLYRIAEPAAEYKASGGVSGIRKYLDDTLVVERIIDGRGSAKTESDQCPILAPDIFGVGVFGLFYQSRARKGIDADYRRKISLIGQKAEARNAGIIAELEHLIGIKTAPA